MKVLSMFLGDPCFSPYHEVLECSAVLCMLVSLTMHAHIYILSTQYKCQSCALVD